MYDCAEKGWELGSTYYFHHIDKCISMKCLRCNFLSVFFSVLFIGSLSGQDQGVILNPTGNVRITGSTPSVSFYEAQSNEFYGYLTEFSNNMILNAAAGQLFFQTGSQNRMVITQSGRVGLGTDSPTGKLEAVLNSSPGNPHLTLSETSTGDFARLSFRNTGSGTSDFWDLAGKATGSGNNPVFNVFYDFGIGGLGGNDYLSIDLASGHMLLDLDVIPFLTSFDVGNNTAGQHWDNCVADDFINFSDRRLKKNIRELEQVLPSLMQLKPVTYQFKKEHNPDERNRTGFIAQDLQQIFPELIVQEDVDIDPMTGDIKRTFSEYLSMNYLELIPITIKALQEQQEMIAARDKEIEDQDRRIDQLQRELNDLRGIVTKLVDQQSEDQGAETLTSAWIKQNEPNPFHGRTSIRYFIPPGVQSAQLKVTDAKGRKIKQIDIADRGKGQIHLDAVTLTSGTYFYSLLLEGNVAISKTMISTNN